MVTIQAPGVAPLVASKSKFKIAELKPNGQACSIRMLAAAFCETHIGDFHFASQYLV